MGARIAVDAFERDYNGGVATDNLTYNVAIDPSASTFLLVVETAGTITAVTIGGVAMDEYDGAGGFTVFYKDRPPTGASVAVNVQLASSSGIDTFALSVFNAASPPVGFIHEDPSDGSAHSKSVLTKDGRSMVVDILKKNAVPNWTPTIGAGQTSLLTAASIGVSYENAPDPSFGATVEMTWDTNATPWRHLAFGLDGFDEGVPAGMTPVVMR